MRNFLTLFVVGSILSFAFVSGHSSPTDSRDGDFASQVGKTARALREKAAQAKPKGIPAKKIRQCSLQCPLDFRPGHPRYSGDQRHIPKEIQELLQREVKKIDQEELWDPVLVVEKGKKDGQTTSALERIQIGQPAPGIRLEELHSPRLIHLSELRSKRPVLLIFGSYTCMVFRRQLNAIEALAQKYRNQIDVRIIYTLEAHPYLDKSPYTKGEWHSAVNEYHEVLIRQPTSMRERKRVARQCQKKLDIQVPVLVDRITNPTWKTYGHMPQSAFLISRDGKVIFKQSWFEPEPMDQAIRKLGP